MSNVGIIPSTAPQYNTVNTLLLPLAVPLLLFSADIRRVIKDTGRLLLIFLIGSVATVCGTLLALKLLPLRSLGADGWKVWAYHCQSMGCRHIGGAVNYVGVSQTLGISSSANLAGLAADNLICAVYFTTLFQMARGIPPDPAPEPAAGQQGLAVDSAAGGTASSETQLSAQVLQAATALALSATICHIGVESARASGVAGGGIPFITVITVLLATAAPKALTPLVPTAEGLAAILMQIFFAAIGANGSIQQVLSTAPQLFLFSLLQIAVHLVLILAAGWALGFTRRDVLLASNANVGGPTTAAGMAAAKGWRTSLVPSLLVGTAGYAIATIIAVFLGVTVLQDM
eukprot:jgi/Astpho2/4584/e_gw1.00067.194.1_t